MNILRVLASLMAALIISTGAFAEGVSGKNKVKADQQDAFALPATVVAASWSGCRLGGNIGAVAAVADPIFGVDGYMYGISIGCDMQLNRIVLGGFLDHQWAKMEAFGSSVDAREWSFGARAGVLVTDSTLLYGLVSRPRLTIEGNSFDGIGLGGGIETKLGAPGWSADLRYVRETFDDLPGFRDHQIRFGINLQFPVPGMPK